jgi:pimeloyl-ACP methyl ester carboxylesterase
MKPDFSNFKLHLLLPGLLLFCDLQAQSQHETKFAGTAFSERLVDIGNHKLFITEKGNKNAKFTVVFESGGGGSSQDWTKVISQLPSETRTVAYDRAGIGKSETGPLPQTMAQSVFELHQLLEAAKIKGPIILVGQSMGGLLVRLYTEHYGKNIAGLVLVDPTHESGFLGSMKYGGWVRLREKAAGKPIPKPQTQNNISEGYDSTVDYMAEEFQNMYLAGVKNPQQLGSRPLVILGAGIRKQPPGTPDEQWKELRSERDKQVQDLTILSGNARFILDPESSHAIQNDNPEVVVKSIQMVINSIVSKTRL